MKTSKNVLQKLLQKDIDRERELLQETKEHFVCEKCSRSIPYLTMTDEGERAVCIRCLFFEKFPDFNYPGIG